VNECSFCSSRAEHMCAPSASQQNASSEMELWQVDTGLPQYAWLPGACKELCPVRWPRKRRASSASKPCQRQHGQRCMLAKSA
jgi:hypothetical protein